MVLYQDKSQGSYKVLINVDLCCISKKVIRLFVLSLGHNCLLWARDCLDIVLDTDTVHLIFYIKFNILNVSLLSLQVLGWASAICGCEAKHSVGAE